MAKLGASFAAAEIPISADGKFSIKFPVTPPSNNNFALAVIWTDDDGVFHRKFLFDAEEGIDYAPEIEFYNGEVIAASAKFEIWNVDGGISVDLDADITLYISRTTNPTTSHDRVSIAADTLTIDTTIYEPLPLATFPLQFNS